MIHLTLFICSALLNFASIYLLLRYNRHLKQIKPAQPVYHESEVIGKAIDLSNAYNNAIITLTERAGLTECETELMNDINRCQRNFLYHLRKINPNYGIIKDSHE